jgi:hypothetical protein
MNPRIRLAALAAGLTLAAACSRPGGESGAAGNEASAVDHAVAAANAIQANPAAADSILTAHGLTRARFDALMYDLAADSALARAYSQAVR